MQNEIFGVHYDLRYKGKDLGNHIAAKVSDLTEKAITEEIVRTARKAGVTDLYLMDKNFLLSAIREKQERTNPKPLTLEELRQMDGLPVWVEKNDWDPRGMWGIVFLPKSGPEKDVFVFDARPKGVSYTAKNYGYWLAYRHKPHMTDDFVEGNNIAKSTNADRIRAMSDEELAAELMKATCPDSYRGKSCDENCELCWLKWLQQPTEEVGDDG